VTWYPRGYKRTATVQISAGDLMTIRMLAVAMMAAIVSGCAADGRVYFTEEECWADRQCRQEWRAEKREIRHVHARSRKRQHVQIAGWERNRDRGEFCGGMVVAVGERAQSEETAQVLALRIWRAQVQFRCGEAYTNFHLAGNKDVLCTAAGVDDTVGGKIGKKFFGVSHYRCELRGRPRRPRPEAVNGED
jgi:hypothetical protein